MDSNVFKKNRKNEISKNGIDLNFTIVDVFLVTKYNNLKVSKPEISTILNVSKENIDNILDLYSKGLDELIKKWWNDSSFLTKVYKSFNDLSENENGDLKSSDSELNISFSNVVTIVHDFFNNKKIGKICNKYLISEDLVKRVSFRYIAGDFDDIEEVWLYENGFINEINKSLEDNQFKEENNIKEGYNPIFKSSEVPYKDIKLVSNDGELKSKFVTLKLKLPEIIDIHNKYLEGESLENLSLKYEVSDSVIDRLLFRYDKGDFNKVMELWESNKELPISSTEDVEKLVSDPVVEEEDFKYISTNVKVGKSYKNHGWTLPRDDLIDLIPVSDYEEECDIIVGDIESKARFDLHPRIFFDSSNDELVNYLKEQNEKNANKKVKLKFILNKSNYKLFPYGENPEPNSKEDYDLLVSKNNTLKKEIKDLNETIAKKNIQIGNYDNWEDLLKYITLSKSGFIIEKSVNGVLKNFGTFENLNDAIFERDELIKNNFETVD